MTLTTVVKWLLFTIGMTLIFIEAGPLTVVGVYLLFIVNDIRSKRIKI